MDTMKWYRDTVLYVYDELCEGEEIACNESPSTSQRSVVSIDLIEDQTVTIIIDTDGADSSETGLSIYGESDSCQFSEESDTSWTSPFAHIDEAHAGSCVPMVAPIWWEWTAQEDGLYFFDTSGSDFDTVLYLLEDCQGVELTCNDDYSSLYAAAEIYALEGDSILVGVGSFAGRTASGTIGVNISK